MEEKHLEIKIFGHVQGVGLREFIKEKAETIGITGIVMNNKDGYVFVEAEGEKDALDEFCTWCKKGPAWADVVDVKIKESKKMKDYSSFSILF